MRCAVLLFTAALLPAFAQNNRTITSQRFTGRYRCSGIWRDFDFAAFPVMGLLGVEDPDAGVTASINMSFHSINGVETTGYRLKGTYDEKTGRFHFEPEPWVSHHPAVYQALGIEGTFDSQSGKITAKMLNESCDAVDMVTRGEKLPPLPNQPPTLIAPRDPKRPETLPGATNVTNYLDPASYSPSFEYLVPAWYDPPGTVHDGEPIDEVAGLMKKEKFLCVGSARVTWNSSGTQGAASGRQDGVAGRSVIECVGDCKGLFYIPVVASAIHFGMSRPLPTMQIKGSLGGPLNFQWKFSRTDQSQPPPEVYVHQWIPLVGFGPFDPGQAEIDRRMAAAPSCRAPRGN
ncbi:MAG TPA: hypothetical protein VGM43_26775 [Bryobacteraceae bacterium]